MNHSRARNDTNTPELVENYRLVLALDLPSEATSGVVILKAYGHT